MNCKTLCLVSNSVLLLGLALPVAQALPGPDPATPAGVSEAYGKLPLSKVKFLSRGSGYSFFLTANEAVMVLKRGPRAGGRGPGKAGLELGAASSQLETVVRMKLVGARLAPEMRGLEELTGKSHYFIGNDPEKWQTEVSQYARVL